MGQIIRERERVTKISYTRDFYYNGYNFDNGGFSFPCDEKGELLESVEETARNNFQHCIDNPDKFKDARISKKSYSYMENAIFRCDCGEEFELYNQYLGACECTKCHNWVNLFGQSLNPPKTWSEGEDW